MERTTVISLDKKPERWKRFVDTLPLPWPLSAPERISAIDGTTCYVPTDWQATPGAYGCLLSHLKLWREAAGAGDVLWVFEDDCVFCDGFSDKLQAFMRDVPDDWEMIYLGGNHILPPRKVCDIVRRATGVKKTHAYAVRGRPLELMPPILERSSNHIDVILSLYHNSMKVYSPTTWLCGQAAGESDVLSGSDGVKERWWQPECAA